MKRVEVVRGIGDGVELDVEKLEILLDRLLELGLEAAETKPTSKTSGPDEDDETRADLLLERVGVVESQQHLSVVLVGEVSVEKSGLGVTDV